MAGDRPLVGSSISNSRRCSMMARPIASICFCPPDSEPAGDSHFNFNAGKAFQHAV